jgi:Ca2+-binding RTX toxin-like protein
MRRFPGGRRRGVLWAVTATVGVFTVTAAATSLSAHTTTPKKPSTRGPAEIYTSVVEGHGVIVMGVDGSAKSETMTFSQRQPVGSGFVLQDTRGLKVVGHQCSPLDSDTAVCKQPGEINVLGKAGDDQITVHGTLHAAGYDFIDGGSGDDTLTVERGDTALFGKRGDDVLYGGHGDNFLVGGPGRDTLVGGAGSDDLAASQNAHDRDRRIDCGPGRDRAFVDAVDPAPHACERVSQPSQTR